MIGKEILKTLVFNRRQFLYWSGLGGIVFLSGQPNLSFAQIKKEEKTAYVAKDYSKLLGMEGFSETLLKNHFTLYQGYVTNTNKLVDTLGPLLKEGKTGNPEYAEMKRRLGGEFKGWGPQENYSKTLGARGGTRTAGNW